MKDNALSFMQSIISWYLSYGIISHIVRIISYKVNKL